MPTEGGVVVPSAGFLTDVFVTGQPWLLFRHGEARREFLGPSPASSPVVCDLVEAPQVVGWFLEVGNLVGDRHVP